MHLCCHPDAFLESIPAHNPSHKNNIPRALFQPPPTVPLVHNYRFNPVHPISKKRVHTKRLIATLPFGAMYYARYAACAQPAVRCVLSASTASAFTLLLISVAVKPQLYTNLVLRMLYCVCLLSSTKNTAGFEM